MSRRAGGHNERSPLSHASRTGSILLGAALRLAAATPRVRQQPGFVHGDRFVAPVRSGDGAPGRGAPLEISIHHTRPVRAALLLDRTAIRVNARCRPITSAAPSDSPLRVIRGGAPTAGAPVAFKDRAGPDAGTTAAVASGSDGLASFVVRDTMGPGTARPSRRHRSRGDILGNGDVRRRRPVERCSAPRVRRPI